MSCPRKRKQRPLGIWDAVEQELFGAPLAILNQPLLVRNLKELIKLKELMDQGATWAVTKVLQGRVQEQLNYWNTYLGVHRGRHYKPLLEQADVRWARLVHSVVLGLRDAFNMKRQLRMSKIRGEEMIRRLDKAGYPGKIVAESSTAAAAACRYVANNQGINLETLVRYYDRYRPLLNRFEYLAGLSPENLERLLSGKKPDFKSRHLLSVLHAE